MTIGLIIAGGVGHRMGCDIPKQFINVFDKPVLLYTLEGFERHPLVDAIAVVCIDGWQESVWAYAKNYGIKKLRWIIDGGGSAQESIKNGVFFLERYCSKSDIVVIHDGIRPLIETGVLTDVINKAKQYGAAVTAMPYNEQIFVVNPQDETTTMQYIPRETLRRVSTPQGYRFGLLDEKYREAYEKGVGINGSSYTNTMMVELGVCLHFAAGSDRNIKLTTQADLDIFKAYLIKEKEFGNGF